MTVKATFAQDLHLCAKIMCSHEFSDHLQMVQMWNYLCLLCKYERKSPVLCSFAPVVKACKPVIFIKFTQRCKCEQSIKSEQRLFGVVRMIKCLSANRIVCIANVMRLLALNVFTHGANVRKTTTLTKFSRGCKCDQTLNSRKFAWSGKYGQYPSLKQVCASSTSDQTHIFVQFFAQVAIYNQKSNFAWASKRRQIF